MTLHELRGKYARLDHEIDALVAGGERNAGRLSRLLAELDDVHRQLMAGRRGSLAVPTLSDVVELQGSWPALLAAG